MTTQRKRLVIVAACILGAALLFYLTCVHYTETAHVGIMRNRITGEMRLDTPGWNISAPWVKVAGIDLRPMRVCVSTAGKGFNCKLVQFEKSAYQEFVETEGFYYYWWANRISFNIGYDEEYRGMRDLLRGYAYGVKQYRFVTILPDSTAL